VKTMTSQSQRIVPMLPHQTVQPKNKEACTAAPLGPPEGGAESSNPCSDGNKVCAVFASIVVMADHDPGRNDGVLLGRRFCWSGLEVIGDYPKPSRRTPMRRNITTADGDASGNVGLAGQTSDQPDAPFPALDLCWRGDAGFAVPGINEWSVIDTNTGAQGRQLSGHPPPMEVHQHVPGRTCCMPNAGAFGQ
jgi:hypothetical protein